ncbi:uncharacterized protein [Prorops nasuta]|uniref:uncharacterized protein isoform X2 n=1 Tax=Prorops nasuta TaxID=863751 RepID=UPI0034CF076F
MSEIDAKINMSLDEIIKLQKKEKKKKPGTAGKPRTSHNNTRGRGRVSGRNIQVKRIGTQKRDQMWKRGRKFSSQANNFGRKTFIKNGQIRSKNNLSANQKFNTRGSNLSGARRGRNTRFGLTRSKSRTNLTFAQGGFFTKNILKKTNSLPNLRDPTSVHSRLGYQSPAQIAYRNRVKRAKQLLLQRQNQHLSAQNQFRIPQAGRSLTSIQQRNMEGRQQILTSQRHFMTGLLRSDQIAHAQRRAQYEQKLMRVNTARMSSNPNVNFMCTLGEEYNPGPRQRSLNLGHTNGGSIGGLRQLPRGRPLFRQSDQNINSASRSALQGVRSRSRSRSRPRNVVPANEKDDRTFSKVMYSLSGNLGVTGRTLNDRFSN